MSLTFKICTECTRLYFDKRERCYSCTPGGCKLTTVLCDGKYSAEGYSEWMKLKTSIYTGDSDQYTGHASRTMHHVASEAQADARHTTMMTSLNKLDGVDDSIKLMCQTLLESNRGIERALDNVNANLQNVTELLKRSAESRNESTDAEWSLVQDD